MPSRCLPLLTLRPLCAARVSPQGVPASLVQSGRMQQAQQAQQQAQQAQQQAQQSGLALDPGRCALSLSLDRMHSAPTPSTLGSLSMSAPAAAEAALAAAAAAPRAPPRSSGPAAAAGGARRQPTVEELQRQLRETQQQLAALVALQGAGAGAPPAGAGAPPPATAIDGRSGSGSLDSGSPERLSSGEAEEPRPAGACGVGLRHRKAASSPAVSVEAVRVSE